MQRRARTWPATGKQKRIQSRARGITRWHATRVERDVGPANRNLRFLDGNIQRLEEGSPGRSSRGFTRPAVQPDGGSPAETGATRLDDRLHRGRTDRRSRGRRSRLRRAHTVIVRLGWNRLVRDFCACGAKRRRGEEVQATVVRHYPRQVQGASSPRSRPDDTPEVVVACASTHRQQGSATDERRGEREG